MMIHKIKNMKVLRITVQLISFILSPGLFILVFSELKAVFQQVISGQLTGETMMSSSLELLLAVLLTALLGRFFCGWLCAFGTFNDLLHILSKKILKKQIKVGKEMDETLKWLKHVVLLIIVVYSWTLHIGILTQGSPWDAFAQLTAPAYVWASLRLGVGLLFLISVGAFFMERFFCRYLCPLGAFFTILSKLSLFKIQRKELAESRQCIKGCSSCGRNCPMGISVNEKETIRGGECINCMNCISSCPVKYARPVIAHTHIKPHTAAAIALIAILGIYSMKFTNFTASATTPAQITATISAAASNTAGTKYKDGTYTGSGTGFRNGTTTVKVTIKNGAIASIETVSSDDTPNFYERVEQNIFSQIVSSQSSSVDTVSGATYSSNGIMEAVQNALDQAGA